MMIRNLIGFVIAIGFCVVLFACVKKGSTSDVKPTDDSIISDILDADLVSFYDAEVEVHVPDYLLLGDTILIKHELAVNKNRQSDDSDFLMIDSTHFLIVKAYDRSYCELTIYNQTKDSIGICYLPTPKAIRLRHEHADNLKVYFYDMHRRILRKYRLKICERYKITEDQLDSLSFLVRPEIDRLRRKFDANFRP